MNSSWDDYKQWVADIVRRNEEYIFRGQQNPEWILNTTFQRYSESNQISWDDYFDKILEDVCYRASAFGYKVNDFNSEFEVGGILAKLQHHGFPTPLLDWTKSPYIAAYFALRDIDPRKVEADEYVTIYFFNYSLWSKSYIQTPLLKSGGQTFFSMIKPAYFDNVRLFSQMAVTIATNISDIESYFRHVKDLSGVNFLEKKIIFVRERKAIMNELNLMGINSATMFPDFDGMCLSLKELHFNNIEPVVNMSNAIAPPPPPIGVFKSIHQ